jgi:hypothetical protein
MPLWKVPEAASGDKKIVTTPVAHQAAGRIHFLEFRADAPVGVLDIVRGNVYARQGVLDLEHAHQGMDVQLLPYVEFYGVRIGQGFLFRRTYNDATFLEVDFVHGFYYLCKHKYTNL